MSGLLWSEPIQGSRKIRLVNEERANQLTHGIGAVLSLFGAVALCLSAAASGDPWLFIGCAVYGTTLTLLYTASTLSHSYLSGRRRHRYRTLDQVSIFLHCAGTYTPVGLTIAREDGWSFVLALIWAMSLIGIGTKLFVTGLRNVPVWFYLAVGWVSLLALEPLISFFPRPAMVWIVAGGLAYSVGTLFLARDRDVRYFHAVWHVFTMIGSFCHFVAIYAYLVPMLS